MRNSNGPQIHQQDYIFKDFEIEALSTTFILQHCAEQINTDQRSYFDIHPKSIEINEGRFTNLAGKIAAEEVIISLKDRTLILSCGCEVPKRKLCPHQAQVLFNLMHRQEIRIFFDDKFRFNKIKQEAIEYGLENETDLDDYFQLSIIDRYIEIKPKLKELFPIKSLTSEFIETNVIPKRGSPGKGIIPNKENTKMILVIGQHRYYKHLSIEILEAQITNGGKIKNPLKSLNPLDFIWKTEEKETIKFFTAITRFKNSYDTEISEADVEALKALVKNPLGLDVFYHKKEISDIIKSSSVTEVRLGILPLDLRLSVHVKDNFFEVNGNVFLDRKPYPLDKVIIQHKYFLRLADTLHLIDNFDFLRIIDFFKKYSNKLLLHKSKFEAFREDLLSKLENKVHINYTFLQPATKEQIQETGLDQKTENILYLSDTEDFVLISPVMKYGTMEIPILSRKQLYAIDLKGEPFSLPRDEEAEHRFLSLLIKQHPDFKAQMGEHFSNDHFYLHKTAFLEENWFLEAFETWKKAGISVLGFKELKDNKFNPNKASVSVSVHSGLNWFDTIISVKFGSQNVRLKHLQKAAKNQSRYVQLGDGTFGILPAYWLERFEKYFQAGEIEDETLKTAKINFDNISTLYEEEVLSQEVKREIDLYRSKLESFEGIEEIKIPKGLKASLRDYQKQGLNWLNFLDEFNFGGCLADDMGLGKTIQILAFILSQRTKQNENTNLVVVPTSLIFNWQAEVKNMLRTSKYSLFMERKERLIFRSLVSTKSSLRPMVLCWQI